MAISRLIPPMGAFLLISAILASRAVADPIGDRADLTPHVEAGSPAAEGTSVAVAIPTGPGVALTLNATPRSGNPLWAIPLSALTATRDRPLFSASRRPPPVAVPIVAPPQKAEALAPPPPDRPLLTLVGTIVSRKASVAMLQGSNAEAISRLRVGQDNDGWRVQGIGLRSIVVEKGPQSVELGLPRADGSPAQ
jgi:general secretion pathway protein N